MLTVTDFFCGAGGSSQGMHCVPGVEVKIAANHWDLAISSHAENFPAVQHDCADISQIDFRRYPRTDLLWASPECTNHSIARGIRTDADRQPDLFGEILPDAAAVRSRATMWDVPRYLEAMILRGKPVLGGVTENVVDVRNWILFDAWAQAIRALGYEMRIVYLNSMHLRPRFGTAKAPQSRDRAYIVYWLASIGREPNWEKWLSPEAHCPDHGVIAAQQAFKGAEWGRYRAQYLYVCPVTGCGKTVEPAVLPAAAAIDWNVLGTRVGDRSRPLAEKTLQRIQAGLDRYAGRPMAVPMEGREGKKPWALDEAPMRTITTRNETGIAYAPEFLPFIAEMRGGGSEKKARGVDEPLATFTASGTHHALVTPPMLVPVGGTWNDTAQPVSEPMRTRTTRETDALLVPYYGKGQAKPVTDPMGTVTTVDRHALVTTEPTPAIDINDCLLRMLNPDEIGRGMAFADDYTVLGNRREQVRQYGNAVTPPAAEVLVSALAEAIYGEDLLNLTA
ncbi:DNA cytosine methyltransferase [Streptomyces sannanensis]|uniref:DNA (cytosine-5-)-methyltransferase n=1 Tax=Streptomyces sannanensis TaxID=285536 RepID=A0ABP6S8Y7_9ACTN